MASKLMLKLLINKKTQKVLFAEADKQFVDFLFDLLALPIGCVTKLLTKQHMVGCIAGLHESLQNLSIEYMQPNMDKNTLLNPHVTTPVNGPNPPLLLQNNPSSFVSKYYLCGTSSSRHNYVADTKSAVCPTCNGGMVVEAAYVRPKRNVESGLDGGGGCVRSGVTYMVTDDLLVSPLSAISSIAILSKFQIKDATEFEEKVVEVGINEGLALLKASLESKTALSDAFGEKVERKE